NYRKCRAGRGGQGSFHHTYLPSKSRRSQPPVQGGRVREHAPFAFGFVATYLPDLPGSVAIVPYLFSLVKNNRSAARWSRATDLRPEERAALHAAPPGI